jgi:UDP-N-acetyl-2-amino-2-deoxyglucuronate dehydrogenase
VQENKKIRAGVIGLGVGEQHIKSYQAIPGCEVVAVCDINPDQLKEVADRRKISGRHTDYRHITEHPDIDVVSICSYDDSHAEQAISAFKSGKHVMLEKPVALHRADAERILRAQQDSGKLITSNLILRRSPRFVEVREMVQNGDFGDIFHIEGDYIHQILWKFTEGWRGKMDFMSTFYGGGIHLVDLMRWIKGKEISEVCSLGSDILTRNSGYRFPDTISALMQFDDGATAKCTAMVGPQRTKFHSLNIYGSKATFVNDIPEGKFFTSDDSADERKVTTSYPGMNKGDMLPELVNAIRTGGRPEVDEIDIFRVMDVCFAVNDALEGKRTVSVNYMI